MNPTDLARERWKPFRQAQEQIEKAFTAYQEAQAKLAELRSKAEPAAAADSLALGKAILAGRAEPRSEADAIRAEIQAQEKRVKALERAHTDAHEQLAAVIKENRSPWHREAMREIVTAKQRYAAAVDELEAAREVLSGAVGLTQWVSSGGAAHAEPANDRLSGSGGSFTQTVQALREDLDAIAAQDVLDHVEPRRLGLELVHRG